MNLTDLKTDPPVRLPNTSPASNAWLFTAKITLTPAEDLLTLPATEDANVINGLVGELNTLVAWRNAYVRSAYARTYGAFDVAAPAGPAPQLLVIQQPKDKPLPAVYGKVAAEGQVDHWEFENVDLKLPKMGDPRSSFTGGPTMVKGSPEAEAFLAAERKAISDAKQRQAVIEASYTRDLAAATKPGTLYHGNINRSGKVLLAELRFTEPPPGGDTQAASFALDLPNDPGSRVEYTAKLAQSLPLNLPAAPVNDGSIRFGDNSEPPVGNLTVNWSKCETKDPKGNTTAGLLVFCLQHGWTRHDLPLLLLNHHLEGVVSEHMNGNCVLSAELTR